MTKIKRYLLRLNWKGFLIVLLLSMIAAVVNENVDSYLEWLLLVFIFGIPLSLLFLFVGKD